MTSITLELTNQLGQKSGSNNLSDVTNGTNTQSITNGTNTQSITNGIKQYDTFNGKRPKENKREQKSDTRDEQTSETLSIAGQLKRYEDAVLLNTSFSEKMKGSAETIPNSKNTKNKMLN